MEKKKFIQSEQTDVAKKTRDPKGAAGQGTVG